MSDLKCPNCQTPHLSGEMVCQKCGMILFDPRTSTVHIRVNPELTRLRRNLSDTQELLALDEHTLQIQIRGLSERIIFEEGTSVVLGRIDLNSPDMARFDLTRFGGHERGVSREHCMISYHNRQFFVTDLNSANGTFVNRKRLQPNQPCLLNDGDELMLGNLSIVVRFVTNEGAARS
ncbi:MAG: FHA domain-containing protein [Anaerolineae bacterium]|nr:FHA domain-containing protein [Anaerolineae bacterium]MDW8297773.1 FHA domain-containing protein [Anaerolineae bacterium]